MLRVAHDAYALFQSENALGPLAFPSLKRMEQEVVDIGLELLHAPEGACGNMTSGGSESIFLAVKTCRDEARARGSGADLLVLPRSAHPAFDKAAQLPRAPLSCACRSARTCAPTSAAMARAAERAHADAGRLGALLPVRRDRPDRGARGAGATSAACGCTSTPASAATSRRSRA